MTKKEQLKQAQASLRNAFAGLDRAHTDWLKADDDMAKARALPDDE